jgi:uncharacterized membrane protein YphA (DoxX/SURF4 family)
MNPLLWGLQGLSALVFLGAGLGKLTQTKEKLVSSPRTSWASDFSQDSLRLLGGAEVLGALGLVLPGALNIWPWVTPVAALSLGVLMAGAVVTHRRRRESGGPALVLGLALLLIVVGRGWLVPLPR